MALWTLVLLLALVLAPAPAWSATADSAIPEDFVNVDEVIADLHVDLRYGGSDNFIGRPVDGYERNRLILTRAAAQALEKVQAQLRVRGLSLIVYDGYRPQRAVDHFVRWAKDLGDQKNKAAYYPDVDKSMLFAQGYIADRSGHTRGSTLDLSIADAATGKALDMGTPWDHFGPESWPGYAGITPQQRANRLLLRALMLANGFKPYEQEWWHFTLENEPYPDTYFDFPVR